MVVCGMGSGGRRRRGGEVWYFKLGFGWCGWVGWRLCGIDVGDGGDSGGDGGEGTLDLYLGLVVGGWEGR